MNNRLLNISRCKASMVGIGLINAVAFIVATRNFTRFETGRQFATFVGLAPFGKDLGTCLKTSPHVSHLANKRIKVLLTQAALCAIRYDKKLQRYYQRKIAEGKHKRVVLNNVKNKLVHIMSTARNFIKKLCLPCKTSGSLKKLN